MKKRLKDIALIQTGYSFRSRLESMGKGAVSVIQMKDLSAENRVDCSSLAGINLEKLKTHHLVKPGDLVFRSRGQLTTSAILLDDPGESVVAAPLIWIRLKDKSVMPEYLNWYINQSDAQSYLASQAKGTAQKMISKQALENLDVFILPLERQKVIVEMAFLAEKEQQLMKMLAEKRYKYISAHLIRMTQGA